MKKALLILNFIIVSTAFGFAQSGVSPGTGNPQMAIAQKAALEFTAEVNGDMFIIIFDVAPQSAFQIELYDITGRKVANFTSDKVNSKRLEFSLNQALGKGLYIVRITSGKQAAAKKFQIQ